ncbi:MAG: putative glycoside hydrolase, partial [Acidimicrobiia bacterium]
MSRVSCYALALAVLTTACGGPSLLVVGEAVRPPDPLLVVTVVDPSGVPITQAEVLIGEESLTTDGAGTVLAEWKRPPLHVAAQAPGFLPGQWEVEAFPDDAIYRLELYPVVLSGRIVDPAGRPVPGASVRLGEVEAASDTNGRFKLIRAVPGELRVERPAWLPSTITWAGEGTGEGVEVVLEPRVVRALYANGRAAADEALWAELLGEARRTEINAMVVDVKDSSGAVFYDSQVPLAREAGAVRPAFELSELLAGLEEEDLYAIARLVAFEDPVVALAHPELAVWDTGRDAPWRSDAGRAWLDPTDPVAQDYLIALAEEACGLGFDEIQFDYVRFPTDGPLA